MAAQDSDWVTRLTSLQLYGRTNDQGCTRRSPKFQLYHWHILRRSGLNRFHVSCWTHTMAAQDLFAVLPYIFPWDAHIWWGYVPVQNESPSDRNTESTSLPSLEDFTDGDSSISSMYLPIMAITLFASIALLVFLCIVSECLRMQTSPANRTLMVSETSSRMDEIPNHSSISNRIAPVPDTDTTETPTRAIRASFGTASPCCHVKSCTARRRRPLREHRPIFVPADRSAPTPAQLDNPVTPKLRLSQHPALQLSALAAAPVHGPPLPTMATPFSSDPLDKILHPETQAAAPMATPGIGAVLGGQVCHLVSKVSQYVKGQSKAEKDGDSAHNNRRLRFVRAWHHNTPLSREAIGNLH